MRAGRPVLHLFGFFSTVAFALSACGTAAPAVANVLSATPASAAEQPTLGPQTPTPTPRPANYLDQLISAAKAEGQLTVIGLPHNWCSYGSVISEFESKYAIQVNELDPNASSSEALQAIAVNKGSPGSLSPDVIDIAQGFASQAVQDGLIQPYQVSTWNDIPKDAKDPRGYWYGDYYGVISFEVNTDVVKNIPADWPDLLASSYPNQVALSGDPRTSEQAAYAVFAAGFAADGGNVADAAKAGMDFFDKLNKQGNFAPIVGDIQAVTKGTAPINLTWDYLSLAEADALGGRPHIKTVVPKTGAIASLNVQAISAYAQHPNAAKLWEEYLYSDAGQLQLLKGYCHPVRFDMLSRSSKIPEDLLAKLPPASDYAAVFFPPPEAETAFQNQISREWDAIVGIGVK